MGNENPINTKFKVTFILKFCLVIGVSSLFSLVILLYSGEVDTSYHKAIVSLVNFQETLVPLIIVTVLIQALFFCLVVIYLTLFLSHKIAGPIYNLEKRALKISEGDLTKVPEYFRKGDQAHMLAKCFSGMTEEIGTVVISLKESRSVFTKKKNEMRSLLRADILEKDKMQVCLEDLRVDVAIVESVLSRIKTSET